MKFFVNTIFVVALSYSLISCSKESYKFKLTNTPKVTLGNQITIKLEQLSSEQPDSIQLFIKNTRIDFNGTDAQIQTDDFAVGKHPITALIFFHNKVKKLTNIVEILPKTEPTLYGYEIVKTYPHDPKAFTQGLEFYNGFLYETTGQKGKSWLRKIDYKTGTVLQQKSLDEQYFGEGITIYDNKVYWLTWQFGKGFIYDAENFNDLGDFKYQKSIEGWGLTHNSKFLIKSDGTNKIWFLDPNTLQESHYIQAYTNKVSLEKLNELEWVEGKIYANYWQKPLLAIINPNSGVVEGIVDLTKLSEKMQSEQELRPGDDVLNGIAYDSEKKRLFVTGKHWNTLYEIKIVKK